MSNKTPVILVDVDGTIALRGDRDPYDHSVAMEDAVNWPVVWTVEALAKQKQWRIIIVSARDEEFREITEYWMFRHGIMEDRLALLMRPHRDPRADAQVKYSLYNEHIAPQYDVQVVFDDRDKVVHMWRFHLNLPCFQVAPGDY